MEGKAKQDYIEFTRNKKDHALSFVFDNPNEIEYNIDHLPDEWANSLKTEFFDSVGLIAYALPARKRNDEWWSILIDTKTGDEWTHGLYIIRDGAIEAAIKKAVEIYNDKYK